MVIYIYFFSVCRFIIIIFAICNSCLFFFLSFLAIVYNCICIDVFCRFITYVNKSSNYEKGYKRTFI